jgi:MFS family permease
LSKHIVDLVLAIALIASFIRGYRAGFLASIFSMIGFVGGGLIGLYVALHVIKNWGGVVGHLFLIVAVVSIGSAIGERILKGFGKFFHGKILFGPFKWLDSLLGAAFSIIRTAILLYIIAVLLLATPWNWAHQNIPTSQSYKYVQKAMPGIVKDVTKEVKAIR